MSGIDATNWLVELASAPAATTMTKPSAPTTATYTTIVAMARGRRGITSTMRPTIGLRMNAISQARKKVSRTSPKKKKTSASWRSDHEEHADDGRG